MKKYDKKLIIDYINGEDLGEFTIDELENDKTFMIGVFEVSNDKRIYNLCGENLKKDYEFVKYLVLKFRDDITFISNIADYFLDNTDSDLEKTELEIIMKNLVKKEQNYNKYAVLSETKYSGKRLAIELYKIKNKDSEITSEIGMGFLHIFDLYNSSDIILKFYAEKIIEDIFTEYDINLEEILHNQFKTVEEINTKGINTYMIEFIALYDPMLASYSSTHLDILKSFSEKIRKIQNNWNNYIEIEEKNKYLLMIERVEEYMAKSDSIFTETLMYYIGKKLGIAKKIAKYDYISEIELKYILEDLSDEFVERIFEVSFSDRIHYENVKKIMIDTLFPNEIENPNSIGNDNKTQKCKVIKLTNKMNK